VRPLTPPSATLPSLLARRVASAGPAPLLTWYDDATGARVELSAVSLANWVAKTACLLAGDLAVEPGETVGVRLPAHWQTAAVLHALWRVGAVADLDGSPSRVQVVAESRLAEPGVAAAEDVLALALRPLGGPLAAPPPPGVLDFAAEVPAQPDVYAGPPPPPDGAALVLAGVRRTAAELVADAAALRLPPAARVLAAADWTSYPLLLAGLVAPLVVDGSAVLVASPDPARLAARAAAERVTVTAGLAVPGLPAAG
jgi:uncharacterized protein (TIGR03089 family)